MNSATYINAKRSKEEKKKGSFVMRDKAYLVEKFGSAGAEAVMEDKRVLQAKRKDHEPVYVMDNPDCPGDESCIIYMVCVYLLLESNICCLVLDQKFIRICAYLAFLYTGHLIASWANLHNTIR